MKLVYVRGFDLACFGVALTALFQTPRNPWFWGAILLGFALALIERRLKS